MPQTAAHVVRGGYPGDLEAFCQFPWPSRTIPLCPAPGIAGPVFCGFPLLPWSQSTHAVWGFLFFVSGFFFSFVKEDDFLHEQTLTQEPSLRASHSTHGTTAF